MREFGDGLQLTVIVYPCRMLTCYLLYCSNFDIAISSFGAFLQPHTSETTTSDLPLALPMFRSGNQSSSRSRVRFLVCMNGLDAVVRGEVCLEFRISNQIWESSHSCLGRFFSLLDSLMKVFHSPIPRFREVIISQWTGRQKKKRKILHKLGSSVRLS